MYYLICILAGFVVGWLGCALMVIASDHRYHKAECHKCRLERIGREG